LTKNKVFSGYTFVTTTKETEKTKMDYTELSVHAKDVREMLDKGRKMARRQKEQEEYHSE
jgi:hypothetical protein